MDISILAAGGWSPANLEVRTSVYGPLGATAREPGKHDGDARCADFVGILLQVCRRMLSLSQLSAFLLTIECRPE